MKFARYLQETQTAEWKKAYIDYRGLKKRITAIRKSQETSVLRSGSRPDLTESPRQSVDDQSDSSDDHGLVSQRLARRSLTSARSARPTSPVIEKERIATQSNSEVTQTNVVGSSKSQKAPSSREPTGSKKRRRRPTFSRGASSFPIPFAAPPTLQETRSLLSSLEKSFLDALDGELDKIETFYLDREKEMTARAQLLHEQLHELTHHRKLFHEAQERSIRVDKFLGIRKTSKSPLKKRKAKSQKDQDDDAKFGYLDPEEYQNAKKKLKKAVVEHYRGLEALHNYRILNMTGFRKALKKFEKVTKIPLLNAYMTEKVEISSFASEDNVRNMMNEMETIFANQFSRGDKKRALLRLRAGLLHKSHHFSTFRSGLFLGLSLPPLVAGIYQSFQTDTRAAIPAWDGLLFVFSVLLVPVVFALLVGTNLLVWSRARVNYVFIFELEYRTRLDHREYFE
ncbi:SPX domain-containing protein, partial [Mucidula mucida]